ncbi:MAG TPA: retropepsin-like aspartic protease [Verrucomicrobiae bacterium]|nr:retropepsin-like aspartic protease [Verrucomicrobiae bacterium]
MRHLVCIVLAAFAALLPVQGSPSAVAEIPFCHQKGLLWIEVRVPQSEKALHFLLDTGAGVSVVNLGTANRIGLKPGPEATVHGVGATMTGYWQHRVAAKVGDIDVSGSYLAVDLEKLGDSCERAVDGLVGMDFFRGRIVEIDYDAGKIRLLKTAKAVAPGEVLPLELRPCGMRVPIRVDGHGRQWVRLDTGCATALQWVAPEAPAQCSRQVAVGLAALSIPQAQTTVRIGASNFENVPTGLHETPIFPGEAGLLGNGLLSRFSAVTIDAKARRLILKRRCNSI